MIESEETSRLLRQKNGIFSRRNTAVFSEIAGCWRQSRFLPGMWIFLILQFLTAFHLFGADADNLQPDVNISGNPAGTPLIIGFSQNPEWTFLGKNEVSEGNLTLQRGASASYPVEYENMELSVRVKNPRGYAAWIYYLYQDKSNYYCVKTWGNIFAVYKVKNGMQTCLCPSPIETKILKRLRGNLKLNQTVKPEFREVKITVSRNHKHEFFFEGRKVGAFFDAGIVKGKQVRLGADMIASFKDLVLKPYINLTCAVKGGDLKEVCLYGNEKLLFGSGVLPREVAAYTFTRNDILPSVSPGMKITLRNYRGDTVKTVYPDKMRVSMISEAFAANPELLSLNGDGTLGKVNFSYSLDGDSAVKLAVYGEKPDTASPLAILVDRNRSKGKYEACWDGRDSSGHPVAAGTYVCRLETRTPNGGMIYDRRVEADGGLLKMNEAMPAKFSPNNDGLNDTVSFFYVLPEMLPVACNVYDAGGNMVKNIQAEAKRKPGVYVCVWDGTDKQGKVLPSGRYSIRVDSPSGVLNSATVEIVGSKPLKTVKAELGGVFPVGCWIDACSFPRGEDRKKGMKAYLDKVFANLRKYDFNYTYVGIEPGYAKTDRNYTDPKNYLLALDTAEKHNLKLLLSVRRPDTDDESAMLAEFTRIVAPIRNHPALFAYYGNDEPTSLEAVRFALEKRCLESVDPKHPMLAAMVGMDNMKTLFKYMQPTILMLDIYPLTNKYNKIGDFYLRLGDFNGDMTEYIDQAKAMLKSKVPLWGVVQAFGNKAYHWRDPSAAEIRAMSYLFVAHGAKGLFYFSYRSQQGWNGLVVGEKGEIPTAKLKEISLLAKEFKVLGPTLCRLSAVGGDKNVAAMKGGGNQYCKSGEIQTLVDEKNGRKYLALVNRDCENRAEVSVNIDRSKVKSLRRITDMLTGKEVEFTVSPAGYAVAYVLNPGDGRLWELLEK
ncbi:MAG: FlgD immunoglobulin-like domain containing protein [Victivallaceae bacterium]|nr:FlgD immunoglobulin-like domain containing protein [Victivallaceae bacterium]